MAKNPPPVRNGEKKNEDDQEEHLSEGYDLVYVSSEDEGRLNFKHKEKQICKNLSQQLGWSE